MDYSIKINDLLLSIVGKRVEKYYYYQLSDDMYHESVYFVIEDKLIDLSNSEHIVELHNGQEALTNFTINQSDAVGFHNGEMSINKNIDNIIITNEIVTLPSKDDYFYKTTKAITFVMGDMIVTVAKDSWADEGLRIIYGEEWKDRIKSFCSNIYDESESITNKSVEYLEVIQKMH